LPLLKEAERLPWETNRSRFVQEAPPADASLAACPLVPWLRCDLQSVFHRTEQGAKADHQRHGIQGRRFESERKIKCLGLFRDRVHE